MDKVATVVIRAFFNNCWCSGNTSNEPKTAGMIYTARRGDIAVGPYLNNGDRVNTDIKEIFNDW